jgi:hypothetical protein
MDKKDDGRSKVEREIDEILAKSEAPIPITAKARSTGWRFRRAFRSLPDRFSRLNMFDSFWGWLLLAIAIYLCGNWLTDQHGIGWQFVRLAGLAALGMSIFRIVKPVSRPGNKAWRGRDQDMNKRGVQLGDRFDEWKRRR